MQHAELASCKPPMTMPVLPTSTVSSSGTVATDVKGDVRALQERLHELISRLADTSDVVKTWPESADDPSVHVNTTSRLIHCIKETVKALDRVEGAVKTDHILRKSMQDCPIALDLLDLLDHGNGNGLNPDCFSRELLQEALGQLAGLKRRKLALEMLGTAIQAGLNKKEELDAKALLTKKVGIKRNREDEKSENNDREHQSSFKKQHNE